jgi:hypothetical protein
MSEPSPVPYLGTELGIALSLPSSSVDGDVIAVDALQDNLERNLLVEPVTSENERIRSHSDHLPFDHRLLPMVIVQEN